MTNDLSSGEPNRSVIHIISGDLWGGAEAQMLLQLAAIGREGYQVTALLFNTGETQRRYELAGISAPVAHENAGFIKLVKSSLAIARQCQPAVIVTHGYKETIVGALLSKRLKIPLVTMFHGVREAQSGWRSIKLSFYLALHRLIARHLARRVITVSESVASDLGFAQLSTVRVIRNVAESNSNERRTVQTTSELLPHGLSHPAIVIVGRLVRVKRVDLAIQSFGRLSDLGGQKATLYIIGDGELRDELKRLVANHEFKARIRMLGFRSDARELIADSDLLLITSDSEGIPSVLLEAIAAGTPIASRKLPGIEETLRMFPDFPARLIPSADPTEIAQAAEALLRSGRPAAMRDDWKRILAAEFSPGVAASKHVALYDELARGKAAAPQI